MYHPERPEPLSRVEHSNYSQQLSQHQTGHTQLQITSTTNFTNQWLGVLRQDITSMNTVYIRDCIAILDSMVQDVPPSQSPPIFHHQNTANHSNENVNSNSRNAYEYDQSHVNAYDSLFSNNFDVSMDRNGSGNSTGKRNAASSDIIEAMQTRYIIIQFVCCLADIHISQACMAYNRRDFPLMAELWTLAYEMVNKCQMDIVLWSSLLFDDEDNGHRTLLPNNHSRQHLQSTTDAFSILSADTERRKVDAIDLLENDLLLNPMLQDRNHVKEKLGEDRWRNIENPKRNFAEVRLPLERTVKEIKEAILFKWIT